MSPSPRFYLSRPSLFKQGGLCYNRTKPPGLPGLKQAKETLHEKTEALAQQPFQQNRKKALPGHAGPGASAVPAGPLAQLGGRGRRHYPDTYAMGSYVQQTVYGGDEEGAAQAANTAITELEDLISWRVEGSDVEQLNQAAGTDFLEIDQRTWNVLRTSLDVCQASGGAFDITIAPISWLWDFDENPRLPQAETIEALLPAVNYENVSLLEDGTAALQTHSTALDLGAVGKGAACDAAVAAYEESGVNRAVVSVGAAWASTGKSREASPGPSPCGTRTQRALWAPSPLPAASSPPQAAMKSSLQRTA